MQIGKRIYYEKETGNIILDTGERSGVVVSTTVDQDYKNYRSLSERNRDSFDVIELEFGQYSQDFLECSGFRVNITTKTLDFTYPNPNTPEVPEYRKPLSEEVERLKAEDLNNKEAIAELYLLSMGGI